MDARAKTIRDILHSGDQYLIPFFQRHYSWKLQHWQRLWEDLTALADDPKARQHFLGPLVCTPVNHMPGELPEYQLIDGQQRLTTISVLLAAIRDLAREWGELDLAEDVTESYLIHKRAKGLKRYKLIPRVGDREVLQGVIEGTSAEQSRRLGIVRAHRFLKAAAAEYVRPDPQKRLRQLVGAVTGRLSLVVITVEGENPYEIFESLNSTGLPLAESDLIRNFIFMRVPMADQDDFHRHHWQPFEAMFEATDDFDPIDLTAFYRDYLMRDGEYSGRRQTFVGFKEQVRVRGDIAASDLVEELKRYARFELMLRRGNMTGEPELEAALDRIQMLDVSTSHPLLMNLLARHADGRIAAEELVGCIADIESFVIRRSICGESTRGYSEMFPAAIKAIGESPRVDLQAYWLRRGWPDDGTFVSRLAEFNLYRREPHKGQLMLEELERAFGHKEGPELSTLTVEHVMPQSIGEGKHGKAWQEMLGKEWQRVHQNWLHSIGNLTLTGYNPNLSNRSFEKKQELLAKSNLQLNRHFAALERWDERAIIHRGRSLAERVANRWPRPEGTYLPGGEGDSAMDLTVTSADLKALRGDYWREFMTVLATANPSLQPRDVGDGPSLRFKFGGRSGARFTTDLDTDEACVSVGLALTGYAGIRNLQVIRQDEQAIEAELGQQVEWEDESTPARAALYLDSAQPANRADWPRQHAWLAEHLQQLIRVIGPRIATPDAEDFDSKRTRSAFWTALHERLRAADVPLEPPTKEKPRPGRELQKGARLYFQLEPTDNWLWCGFEFEGKIGLPLYGRASALARLDELAVRPVQQVHSEESDEEAWIGCYRLVVLKDRERWEEYLTWGVEAARTFLAFYDAQLKSLASSGG
jgi:hypothetical protein